jgi:hypothetical protein
VCYILTSVYCFLATLAVELLLDAEHFILQRFLSVAPNIKIISFFMAMTRSFVGHVSDFLAWIGENFTSDARLASDVK